MKKRESIAEKLILLCAVVSVIAVILISLFIFSTGGPTLVKVGIGSFVLGESWAPGNGDYGILPLIAGTMGVTLGALLIGIPAGLGCAVFLSQVVGKKVGEVFKGAIALLAGIPSVVYGFFGLAIVVPWIRKLALWLNPDISTSGFSLLAGAIILSIMILPTIVSLSENAISSVPKEYKEASLALGADHRETIVKVLIPAAKSGIFSSVILAMGRAIGETMAVLLITGNVATMPDSVFSPVGTMTGTIAMEMSYATESHQKALFSIGIVLFVIIVLLNGMAQGVMKKFGGKEIE